jgi:hypothetical protein
LYRRLGQAAILAGLGLRVALAWFNLDANDNHLEAIRIIAYEKRVPQPEDAWEAYQPPLYYAVVAAAWRLMPEQVFPESKKPWVDFETYRPFRSFVRIAQFVNCGAGLLTMVVAWRFFQRLQLTERVRLWSLSFVALNPGLIGINAQATNDSFAILFGSLLLYGAHRFLTSLEVRWFLVAVLSAILATITKGNGFVACLAVLTTMTLLLRFVRTQPMLHRKHLATYALVFFAAIAAVTSGLNPYLHLTALPDPGYQRPGVTSLSASFLTFRVVDMLKNPMDYTLEPTDYPLHRTSLWSQLYGRTHSVHFDAHPGSWESLSRPVRNLGRFILLFALMPTALFTGGLIQNSVWSLRCVLTARASPAIANGTLLMTVASLGYLAFSVALAATLKDYSVMKAIYIFPGLLAFVTMFALAADEFSTSRIGTRRWLSPAIDSAFLVLFLLYITDVMILISALRTQLALSA